MSNLNTDEIRKAGYVKSYVSDDCTVGTLLDEIDRLREACSVGKCDGYDKGYLDSKYGVELIEEETKKAYKKAIEKLESKYFRHEHDDIRDGLQLAKQAIDSAGGDPIDISRKAQLKVEELSKGGP